MERAHTLTLLFEFLDAEFVVVAVEREHEKAQAVGALDVDVARARHAGTKTEELCVASLERA